MPAPRRFFAFLAWTTPAVWLLLVLSLGSALVVLLRPRAQRDGLAVWTFAKTHATTYAGVLDRWNGEHAQAEQASQRAYVVLFDGPALERRLLSAFMSGTPAGDLIEVERGMASRTFTGPLEDVGFVDLTDRLRAEGMMDVINLPSFAPWITRGRVFGIPHDVHPVLLAYRSDLTDAAGIDMAGIETWEDFFTALRPLMADTDGDGRADRYLLNFWANNVLMLDALILQAGGGFFDAEGRVIIDSEINAHVLSTLATWCAGPSRVALDAPEFTAAGNTLRLRGAVVASLMPDWLAGIWKADMPSLAGNLRLMPIPAWERGGRRTSTVGGTMLGIPKSTRDFDTAWTLAKRLYLDADTHAAFFRATTIIPPVKTSWSHPAFAEPDPYFGGQQSGLLYIAQAGAVPMRNSSPYATFALERVSDALLALADRAGQEQIADPALLLPEARELLREAQRQTARQIERNVFLRVKDDPAP